MTTATSQFVIRVEDETVTDYPAVNIDRKDNYTYHVEGYLPHNISGDFYQCTAHPLQKASPKD